MVSKETMIKDLREFFKDKVEKEYGFYSIVHKCEYYDENWNVINI